MIGDMRTRNGYPGLGRLAVVVALIALAFPVRAADFVVREVEIEDRKAVVATVESVDRIAARARIGGTVAKLAVDEGASVRKGDVLAEVVDTKLDSRRQAVEARIQALESQKKLAQTVLDRVTKLRETGAAAQSRLDEALTSLRVVDRDLAAMIAERKVVLEQQAEGAVLAPSDGRVLAVPVTGGAVVMFSLRSRISLVSACIGKASPANTTSTKVCGHSQNGHGRGPRRVRFSAWTGCIANVRQQG